MRCEIQGLDADAITNEPEAPIDAIVGAESKHADEPPDGPLDAPRLDCRAQYLGIGVTPKCHTLLHQFEPELRMVVDFTVERHDEAALGRCHWLMAFTRQIDNGEP